MEKVDFFSKKWKKSEKWKKVEKVEKVDDLTPCVLLARIQPRRQPMIGQSFL